MAERETSVEDLAAEGFCHQAKAVLEIHIGGARLLQAMLAAGGRPVSIEALDRLTVAKYSNRRGGSAEQRIATRICWLRDALVDVGFARAAIYRTGDGYAIRRADAAAIRRFVLAGARDPSRAVLGDRRLILALFERLPAAGSVWGADERQAWLQALATAFDLVYRRPPGEAHAHVVAARRGEAA